MQTSGLKKRAGAAPNTFLGVDADALGSFPPRLRSEIIAALSEADLAKMSGDEKRQTAATARLTRLAADIQQHQVETGAEKFFKDATGTVRGDHNVMRKFAHRAGVRA
jgi:hypothetical protein